MDLLRRVLDRWLGWSAEYRDWRGGDWEYDPSIFVEIDEFPYGIQLPGRWRWFPPIEDEGR